MRHFSWGAGLILVFVFTTNIDASIKERLICKNNNYNFNIYKKYRYQLNNNRQFIGFPVMRVIDENGEQFLCLATVKENYWIKKDEVILKSEFNPAGKNPDYYIQVVTYLPVIEFNSLYISAGKGQSIGEYSSIVNSYEQYRLGMIFSSPALFSMRDFLYYNIELQYSSLSPTENSEILDYWDMRTNANIMFPVIRFIDLTAMVYGGMSVLFENLRKKYRRTLGFGTGFQGGAYFSFTLPYSLSLGMKLEISNDIERKIADVRGSGNVLIEYRL